MTRKLAFLGAGLTLVAVGAVGVFIAGVPRAQQTPVSAGDSVGAAVITAEQRASLPGPHQPIFFRHDIHAGQFKMQCQYCHYSVGLGPEPGIPTVQTCMGCHLVISGSDSVAKAEITLVRKAWADQKPIEWVRIHTLARHVHFPHMRHIKALGPNACATCHGEVSRMPQVLRVNNVNNMGFCISCHLERKVSRDCTACHY